MENPQDFSLNLDDDRSMGSSATVNIVDYTSGGGMLGESELSITRDGDTIIIKGLITANTGGHEPVVGSVSVEDDTLHISIGLKSPNGLATQAISSYEYTAKVENFDNHSRIEIKQDGQSKTIEL